LPDRIDRIQQHHRLPWRSRRAIRKPAIMNRMSLTELTIESPE
jgi:hypothetical protein